MSDCVMHEENVVNKHMLNMLSQTKFFLLICSQSVNTWKDSSDNLHKLSWDRLTNFVNNDANMIYEYVSEKELAEKIYSVLPKKYQTVFDCSYANFSTTKYCTLSSDKKCVRGRYPNIIQYPESSDLSIKCPVNTTVDCDPVDCSCEKNEWVISGKCCDGKQSFKRDVSHMPSCPSIKQENDSKCSTPCAPESIRPRPTIIATSRPEAISGTILPQSTENVTLQLNESNFANLTPTSASTVTTKKISSSAKSLTGRRGPEGLGGQTDEPDKTMVFVAIGIGATLFVVLLLLLLLFLLVHRRKKKKKKLHIVTLTRSRHKKHGDKKRMENSDPTETAISYDIIQGKPVKESRRKATPKPVIDCAKKRPKVDGRGIGVEKKHKQKEKGVKVSVELDKAKKFGKKKHK